MKRPDAQPRATVMERVWAGIAWLRIVGSPTLFGPIVGGVVYLGVGGTVGHVAGGALALIGVALGVLWAEKVRRTTGTVEYLAAVTATHDLDSMSGD